ncbi:MAG: hypothetical protein Fur0032_02380 [Terrimicrobiaceae bacterium]
MTVSFFIPRQYLPDVGRREAWKSGSVLAASGKEATAQAWIFQTAMELEAGWPEVRLVTELPTSGIVVALAGNLPPTLPARPGRFLIDVVADGSPHPSAQKHICQNPLQARKLPGSVFLPHWPQPGLIPRDPARGDRWENVCFYGDPGNLHHDLAHPDFARCLRKSLGMDIRLVSASGWHDFSQTDCVLAVRDPGLHPHKPATKLYNAWLAGVPFIGGRESAYIEEGRLGVNFVCVEDFSEVLPALKNLAENPDQRRGLVAEGSKAAKNRNQEATTLAWRRLLTKCIEAEAPRWMARSPATCRLLSHWHSIRLRIAMATLRTS